MNKNRFGQINAGGGRKHLTKLSLLLALTGGSASALNSTPSYTVTGHVNYVALGASFRTNSGNSANIGGSNRDGSACRINTASGVHQGSNNGTMSQAVGAGATVTTAQRAADQLVPTAAGTTVKQAILYWSATTPTGVVDTTVDFTVGGVTSSVTASASGSRAIPVQDYGTGGQAMWASADVTSLVRANPNATMTMDGLTIGTGGDLCLASNVYGNWNLYIVYENAGLATSKVSIFDSNGSTMDIAGGPFGAQAAVTPQISGFFVPNGSSIDRVARATVHASEGDPVPSTDYFRFGTTSSAVAQSSTNRPTDNFYRSIVSVESQQGAETLQGGSTTTTTSNTGGLDIFTFNADTATIPPGAKTLYAAAGSGTGDMVILNDLALIANTSSVDVAITKRLFDPTRTTYSAGSAFSYVLAVNNTAGTTEALNVVTTDTLPSGLTYNSAEISYDGGATWTTVTAITSITNGVTTVTFPAIRRIDPDGTVWGGTNQIADRIGTQNVLYKLNVTAADTATGTLRNNTSVTSSSQETTTANNSSFVDVSIVTPVPPAPNPTTYPTQCDAIRWRDQSSLLATANGGSTAVKPNGDYSVTSVAGVPITVNLKSATITSGTSDGIFGVSSTYANNGSWTEVRAVSQSLQPNNDIFLTRASSGTGTNTITVTFPYPVTNIRFGISDVDAVGGGGTATQGDWLSAVGSYGGSTFNPTILVGGGAALQTQAYNGVPTGVAGVPTTQTVSGIGNSTMGAASQPNSYSTLMGVSTSYGAKNPDGTNRQGQGVAYFEGPLTSITIQTGSLKPVVGQGVGFGDIGFCAPKIELDKESGAPVAQADGSIDIPYTVTYRNVTYLGELNPDATLRSPTFTASQPTPAGFDEWAWIRPEIRDDVVNQLLTNTNVQSATVKPSPTITVNAPTTYVRNLDNTDVNTAFNGTTNPELISQTTDGRVNGFNPATSEQGSFTTNFTVNVVPKTTAPTTFDVSNTATGKGYLNSPTALTAQDVEVTTLTKSVNLQVEKTPDNGFVSYTVSDTSVSTLPRPVTAPQVTYTIRVTNPSTQLAQGVQVTDTLPDGLTNVTVVNSAGTQVASTAGPTSATKLTWSAGDLAAGATAVYTVTATAPALNGANATQLVNAASAKGSNTLEANDQANYNVIYSDLVKRVRNVSAGNTSFGTTGTGNPGDILEYCLDYKNYGTTALQNWTVEDTIPANTSFYKVVSPATGVTYDSATNKVVYNQATLGAGEAGSVCFQVQIGSASTLPR